jgi:hypothetical protein
MWKGKEWGGEDSYHCNRRCDASGDGLQVASASLSMSPLRRWSTALTAGRPTRDAIVESQGSESPIFGVGN